MENFNYQLFMMINVTPDSPLWAIELAEFLAKQAINIIPIVLLVAWLWVPRRELVIKTLIALVFGVILAKTLGTLFPHVRPFIQGVGYQLLGHGNTPSFPSNHGTGAFTFALAFLLWGRLGMGMLFMVWALGIAWSRVYLGVHWPMDMAGAFMVALVSCFLTQWIWSLWGRAFLSNSEKIYHRVFILPIKKSWVKY
ncbi:undecaprenyl-diphosphate phosphatase [Budviciaceae bacterium BWR-B9]|uniref:undecaprenyl-diphosphate phosphatase n=1 Tax=Limnobaculum allomyrinae TaxID=2791986 RepID=A0ABS1IRG0_9GAMM|nr:MULTISPECIES: undecaprenyl-diphosphate phosphatase [Limnobaculum]MBK5144341.1 undecaprenyl-diphosphate phosphatase [Limnobaculum allomyrinae]MBV7691914.1 undecaprenyl-diphosphate phosphatase [Limnobaculum sp. M2-1]